MTTPETTAPPADDLEALADFLTRIADLSPSGQLAAARDRAESLASVKMTPRQRQEERDALRENAGLKATDFAALSKPNPKATHLRVVDEDESTSKPVLVTLPIPGSGGLLLDLLKGRIIERRAEDESVYLDWAPRLLTWWTDPEGVPIYHVTVKGQEGYVLPETLRDGTAWDQFDHAAGHDVRKVREALAGCVKLQRRTVPRSPGLDSLGWHEINGEWVYVSADRCFGPSGEVVANINTHSSDESALPEAPTGDRLREVVALSLSVLDVAVLRVSAPAMCSVWLAPLISRFGNDLPRFVPWMWSDGRAQVFGVLKSSLAAILQAHAGTGYRGEGDLLPAADTTLPSLSGILGERRDGLVIVDDYKPGETTSVDNKTQGTAEQGIRAATNRQRRAKNKMRGVGRAKVAACMALLMYTAECLPLFNSGSTHDRTFPFQVHKGDVRMDRLTVLQDRVDDFPEATAGYVAWLAANHDTVTAFLAERFRELRAELRAGEEVTGRACSHIAHMLCAAEVFTRFAVEVGAMTEDERDERYGQIWDALIEAATSASTERAEDQPHEVWLRNLRSLFASGKLYAVAPRKNPSESSEPYAETPKQYADALGWAVERRDTLAGYALSDGLGVVESEVNPAITRRDKSLTIGGVQLRRLLASQGIIRPEEHKDGKHDHLRQVRIGSSRPWLMVIPWEVFLGTDKGPAPEDGGNGGGGPEAPQGPQGPAPCKGCGHGWYKDEADASGYHPNCAPAVAQDRRSRPVPGDLQAVADRAARGRHSAGDPTAPAVQESLETAAVREVVDVPAPSGDVTPSRPGRKTPTEGQVFDRLDQEKAFRDRVAVLDGMDPEDDSDEAINRAASALRIMESMTDDPGEDRTKDGPFAPAKFGKYAPFWTAPLPDIAPPFVAHNGWGTFKAATDYRGTAAVLDRNAGHPSALSSLRVAHGPLEASGALPDARRPGYYKTVVHPWTRTDLPSPMGNREIGTEVWVTAERMRLLIELADLGPEWWPDAVILDSRTAERETSLRDLSQLIKHLRAHVIDTHGKDSVQWEAVKEATNTKLIQILMGSPKSTGTLDRWIDREWFTKCHRTDWAHALHDKAAMNLYRVALKLTRADVPVLAMRHMDEILIPADEVENAITRGLIKADEDGRTFGTFKTKGTESWGE